MKKLLSVILAVAMIISLIPATVFATTGAPVVIEFSDETFLNSDGTKFSGTGNVSAGSYITDTAKFEIVTEKTYTSATVRPWNNGRAVTGKKLLWITTGVYEAGKTDNRSLFTVRTKQLPEGDYSVKIVALKANNGTGNYDVLINGTNIGSFNAQDDSGVQFKNSTEFLEKSLSDVTVTPDTSGYTEIQFKNIAESGAYLSVYQIVFTPKAGEEEPDEPEYVGDPVPVELIFSDTTIKDSTGAPADKKPPADWVTTDFEVDLSNTYKSSASTRLKNKISGTDNIFLHFYSLNNWVANLTAKPGENRGVFTVKTKKLKAPGYYNVKLMGVKNTSGVDSYVYVNGQYAGLFDFHDAEATLGSTNPYEDKQLNTIYIKPDKDGYVTVKLAAADDGGSYMDIYRLSFIPADVTEEKPLEYADIELDFPKEIYQGESGEFAAYAKMSDGSAYHMAYYNADATAVANPDSISAKADGSGLSIVKTNGDIKADGVFKGTITANELGEHTFTVTVKIGGNTYEKQGTVEVKLRPKLNFVGLTYDKTLLPMTRTAHPALTLVRDDGNPCTEDMAVVWESSDDTVAAVSEDGTVTGTGIGTAVIRATVTTQNATVWGEATVTVTEAPALERLELEASSSVMPGTKANISLKAFMDDGEEANTYSNAGWRHHRRKGR